MSIELKLRDFIPFLGFRCFYKRNKFVLYEMAGEDLEKYPLLDKLKVIGNLFYHLSCFGLAVTYSATKAIDYLIEFSK